MLDSSKLRILWLIIEQTQTCIYSELSDSQVVQHILFQLQERILLSTSELFDTKIYIHSRLHLIRDLAEIRLITEE